MFHTPENWFTLLTGFIIVIMGLRVFWLDSSNRIYVYFMISTMLLFIQQLFFFEMAHISDLEAIGTMRRWQESIWNLAAMTIFITMWYYGRKFTPRRAFSWEKKLFWGILITSLPFVFLQAFSSYGHGEMMIMENGKWGVAVAPFAWWDFVRSSWVICSYLGGIYFAYLPFRHARDPVARRLRLIVLLVFAIILLGSYAQNYVVTWLFGIPSPLNESLSVIIAILFCGLMLSNFQLFELRSEYTLPNILRTMTNWFILTDAHFNIKQVNEALAEAFDLQPEDALNRKLTELLPPEQWKSFQSAVQALRSRETKNCEFRFQLDGRTTYILFTITPVLSRQGIKGGYVFVGTNLTSFRESEIQIREYTRELESSNQALERFAYIASHDLKEPIRNIGNFAGLLKRRLGSGISEENAEFLSFIINNVKGMNQLIESVMAVSLIGQNGLQHKYLNPVDVLAIAVDNLDATIRQRNAKIEYPSLPQIYGDQQLLTQLFQNLLENALKYNEEEVPKLLISCTPAEKPGYWEFIFTDNGIGIDPEYREQVFEMFKRLHTRNSYPGTGIGLAICRRIVELHRGEIWISSSSGKPGTTFRFTLPSNAEAISLFSTDQVNSAQSD